jgi:uncharacterized surface protein with fasciclin (FAS1) repeats
MQPKHLLTLAIASGVSTQTLSDILAMQNATLSILNSFLVQEQALVISLSNTKDITVLAPSNNALSQLLNTTDLASQVTSNPSLLPAILSYHILSGTFYASSFTNAPGPLFIQTLLNTSSYSNVTGGQRVMAAVKDGKIVVMSGAGARATVQSANFNFTGGTLHIIDSVLSIPANLTSTLLSANATAAVGAIQQAGLAAPLTQEQDLTVFAPNNDAFNAIGDLVAGLSIDALTSVLGYHVI